MLDGLGRRGASAGALLPETPEQPTLQQPAGPDMYRATGIRALIPLMGADAKKGDIPGCALLRNTIRDAARAAGIDIGQDASMRQAEHVLSKVIEGQILDQLYRARNNMNGGLHADAKLELDQALGHIRQLHEHGIALSSSGELMDRISDLRSQLPTIV